MGTLYSIATPIGNLEDMTYRAVRILKEVDLILCENPRNTKRLLDEYHITTKTKQYNQHTTLPQQAHIVEELVAGMTIALVTDAGTPGISDPGSRLVHDAIAAGVPIIPIPGPSAVITTLQASGILDHRFHFVGFIPHKKGRKTLLDWMMTTEETVVAYESPHRIVKTLIALKDCTRQIVIGRELTKQFEEILRGTATELLHDLEERNVVKGEFVIVVHD